MAGNDYRKRRSVLHCVVDSGVYVALKCLAADQGRSVTDVVNGVLLVEVERHGYVTGRSFDRTRATEESVGVRQDSSGDSGTAPLSSTTGRGLAKPDWDSIIAAGLASKRSSVVVVDPIEEIA